MSTLTMSFKTNTLSSYTASKLIMTKCEDDFLHVCKGTNHKKCILYKVIFLLLLFVILSSSEAASRREKFALRRACQAGLLQHNHLETDKDASLESFLSLSLTPLSALKEELWVRVRMLDIYGRPVYLLELSQSADVGCWLSLRHVQSGEIIAKVLWPKDVLQRFKQTLITMVLKGGVLRVTAVKMETADGGSHPIHHSPPTVHVTHRISSTPGGAGVLKAPNSSTSDDLRSGPFLMLATLRRVHEVWGEPQAVSLRMMSTAATLYYRINCATDDLQWAWMDALGVHTNMAVMWLPWLLLTVAAVLIIIVAAERRWHWCSRHGQIFKPFLKKKVKEIKADEKSPISSSAGLAPSPQDPSVTVGKVSSRAPSPGVDLAAEEIRVANDKDAYTNYAYV